MTTETDTGPCDVTFMDTQQRILGTIKMNSKPVVDKQVWWGDKLYYVSKVLTVHWVGEPCHHTVAVITDMDSRWFPDF